MDPGLAARARRLFAERFGAPEPAGVAFAPGRVNLIGEHTDYNDGFVLPMGIDRGVVVAFRRRPDRRIRAHAALLGETRELELDGLEPRRVAGWAAYVAGVAWTLAGAGHRLPGLDVAIDADLPLGAGLASSAALELAVARGFSGAADLAWDPLVMARLCHRAENDFVGMPCGLMDQLAAAISRGDGATLLDCRSLETQPVPLPRDAALIIMDTGVRRTLTASPYADRLGACSAAVAALRTRAPQVRALRDANAGMLEALRDRLDPVVYRRARHVIEENGRPPAMAAALRAGDLRAAGRLMNQSHASLRDLYQVSSPELDALTDRARSHPACFGARMTGAGFGGCAIALVRRGEVESFEESVRGAARAVFVTGPEGGARLV
ncbi:MAG: galactokinase [Gemmatimonadetes bacterium]|nr:galactokinase [Gemmatimonadota bacterium]